MSIRTIDPKETYVVRQIFCCGEGHCPGIKFTHWESGEACPYDHSSNASNEDCHFYWRLALVPRYRGNWRDDPNLNQYSKENGDFWDFARLPENVNRWSHFIIAPKGLEEGNKIKPSIV